MTAVKDVPETPRPALTPAEIAALLALMGAALLNRKEPK